MTNKKFTNSMSDALENFWVDYVGWGRATRSEYWWVVLWYNFIISYVLSLVAPLSILWGLLTIVPGFCLTARRLHDGGYSNWFQLLLLIPFIGWIALIALLCQPSEKKANKWGKPRIRM